MTAAFALCRRLRAGEIAGCTDKLARINVLIRRALVYRALLDAFAQLANARKAALLEQSGLRH